MLALLAEIHGGIVDVTRGPGVPLIAEPATAAAQVPAQESR
jgi:hypothetical protein